MNYVPIRDDGIGRCNDNGSKGPPTGGRAVPIWETAHEPYGVLFHERIDVGVWGEILTNIEIFHVGVRLRLW
jgi:hypothetical protein